MTDTAAAPFDRLAVRRHRDRAATTFDATAVDGTVDGTGDGTGDGRGFDFLFTAVGDRLVDRLDDLRRRFPVALDLGCRTGGLADRIAGRGGIDTLIQLELSPAMATIAARRRPAAPVACADAEALPLAPASLDLAISCLDLHWVNDLPGALIQLRRALKPDGLLLAALFGLDTLPGLRHALAEAEIAVEGGLSPRMSPFTDVRDAGGLLQRAGFALPVVDSETITVSYATPLHLMRDLRGMGETNAVQARRRGFSRRATLLRAATLYADRHGTADGRVAAPFQILTLTAWAPSETQQQPLRPGSATHRLAEAMHTVEHSAGEKAGCPVPDA